MTVDMKALTTVQRQAFHFICKKQLWTAIRAPTYAITQEQLIEVLAEFAEERYADSFEQLGVKSLAELVERYDAKIDREKNHFRQLDSIIDEEGVARSCINPFEDLRLAIRRLKTDHDAAQVLVVQMKAERDELRAEVALLKDSLEFSSHPSGIAHGCPYDYSDPESNRLLQEEKGHPQQNPQGTFNCPICGHNEPHEHASEEVAAHQIKARAVRG